MAAKVFLHLGLPKTATTYLQTLMWADRDLMRSQGVLLPGRERRDHLWSSRIVREDPNLAGYDERRRTAWDRLRAEIAAWDGNAVISHEFFAGASAEQAVAMIDALAPAEVHLVVTAREPVGLFASSWQESLKNRETATMAEYATAPVSESSQAIWNWRTLDVRLVLERWAPALPPAQVHVLPLPGAESPRSLIWERFAALIGLDPAAFDLSASFPNESMGVVEAETLRRINLHLQDDDFDKPFDKGVYIRTFLADQRLVPRGGDRFWPDPDAIADCRARGEAAVAHIREAGYDVVGDLESLRVPAELPERRTVGTVTEAEVAATATALAGRMLHDVRDLTKERNRLQRQLAKAQAEPPLRAALVHRWPWLGRVLSRSDTPSP
ncbi:hypothetical protein EFK50_00815 [Nocardioides marmoriginsengisoli]|uniref:Sulfotransferase family protein n=1 Tax=Nocardioides marmoriginsengisoli TaxID=661483 RepID=A0A3N0CS23_9ACTN|nr:hypothetical protein [Nocardioides marmoriginsengisoli]RNL66200.1 hypothetical protein EFK50_00815 [Nocardioides marmoriginsengisoli]